MSRFSTVIPVDIESVRKLLAEAGSYIEGTTYNAQLSQVEIVWSNHNLITPFTFPVPFSVDALKARKLPENTKLRQPVTTATTAPLPTPAVGERKVLTKVKRGVKRVSE